MDGLDASVRAGALVVRKRVVGEVVVSTNPPTIITESKPVVVAVGRAAVLDAVRTTNVRGLFQDGTLEVLL